MEALEQQRDLHATARTNLEEQRTMWEEEKQALSTRAAELSSQVAAWPSTHRHADTQTDTYARILANTCMHSFAHISPR